jgi:hypothetical protein
MATDTYKCTGGDLNLRSPHAAVCLVTATTPVVQPADIEFPPRHWKIVGLRERQIFLFAQDIFYARDN